MHIILIPGNSESNKEWLAEWKRFLEKNFIVHTIEYDHWDTEKPINIEVEKNKIKKITTTTDEPIMIVAKSIGSVVATKAIFDDVIKPQAACYLGFPSRLDGYGEHGVHLEIKKWIQHTSVPTYIFQNQNDPVTSAQELISFCSNIHSVKVMTLPGDTHAYTVKDVGNQILNICAGIK